jgi:hypothetical protein
MCRAAGKEWSEYRRLKGTNEFLSVLALGLGILQDQLAITTLGTPGGILETKAHGFIPKSPYISPSGYPVASTCASQSLILATGFSCLGCAHDNDPTPVC